MQYETVIYEIDSGVAFITLNRPAKLNAITPLLYEEMRTACHAADADDEVRVIVLTGAGKGFCAGADSSRLESMSSEGRVLVSEARWPFDPEIRGDFQDRYTFQAGLKKPVVAAINGAAAGMGLTLALFCDIRLAADDAVLTTSFARLGLVAESGIAWRLDRLVGPGRAADLLMRSPRISGLEAAAIGLVEGHAPAQEFPGFFRDYALRLANEMSPRSLRVMKRQLWNAAFQTLAESQEESRREVADSMHSEDFREGVSSRREKRPPRFKGK